MNRFCNQSYLPSNMTADDDIIEKHGRRLHKLILSRGEPRTPNSRYPTLSPSITDVSAMAYRDYNRENSEVYGSSISYLDGVPFKISSAFKPPTKVQLPSTLMRKTRVSATRHEEYSFEIEEGVLQWALERERQLEAQKREEEERQKIANQIREQENQRSSSEDSEPEDEWLASHQSSCPSLSGVKPPERGAGQVVTGSVPLHPVTAGLSGSDILTPTPIHTDENNRQSYTASQNVDVSQFENVDDPFDMFERQTLNDIEELKSVFSTTDTNAKTTNTNSFTVTNQSEAESIYENVNSNNSDKIDVCRPPNGLVGGSHECSSEAGEYVQVDIKQAECEGRTATSKIDRGNLPPLSQTKEFLSGKIPLPPIGSNGKLSLGHERVHSECEASSVGHSSQDVPLYENVDSTQLYENVQILQDNRVSFNPNKYSRNNLDSTAPSNYRNRPNYVNVMPHGLGTAGTMTGPGENPSGMRNALSSPDISGINNIGLHDYDNTRNISPVFSRSPPPRPSSHQSWNKYQPLPVTISSSQDSAMPSSFSSKSSSSSDLASPSEVDPYLRLSPEAQHAVDNLVSMGFSKPRSARAVEKFGKDEKEVIDHLCGVNNLSEKGFDTYHAEMVLLLYNNNLTRAEKYLDMFQQFKELGFSHDRIKEALVTNNLDREKALDFLTT